jgi:hypothetical protein
MGHKQDDTLTDLNRREIAFPESAIEKVLPEFFRTEYPKLITLLDEYYHYEDDESSPTKLINDLFYSRDITQTDIELLSYIEDELLLGQSYFEGFSDKRAAAKYSNTLYRSKGTKYSIQQFFRTFFSVDPDIIYTKEQVFNVGEASSEIGFDSRKFLTDNKLYQKFAILIKSDISFNEWREPYKLFVHPAGMFIGSEVQIISDVTDTIIAPNVLVTPPPPIAVHSEASFGDASTTDLSSLVDDFNTDSAGILSRLNSEIRLEDFTTLQIAQIQAQYNDLREAQVATSPTMDDSDTGSGVGIGLATFNRTQTNTLRNNSSDITIISDSVNPDNSGNLVFRIPSDSNDTFARFVGNATITNGTALTDGTIELGNSIHNPPKIIATITEGSTTGRYIDSASVYEFTFTNIISSNSGYTFADLVNEYDAGQSGVFVNAVTESTSIADGMDMSNDFAFETFDQDRHVFYSGDSDEYLSNLGHLS